MEPTEQSFMSFLPGAQQEDDKMLIVQFFVKPKLMGLKSIEAGHEVYEDREYVEIKIKGQSKQIVVEEVTLKHKKQYPIAYHQFFTQKPLPLVGSPIEQLPGLGPSMAIRLKQLNIRSIEDMAGVSDETVIQEIGAGARDLIKRAKAFLSQTSVQTLSLAEENSALKGQLTEQGDAIRRLQEQLAILTAPKARKLKARKLKANGAAHAETAQ